MNIIKYVIIPITSTLSVFTIVFFSVYFSQKHSKPSFRHVTIEPSMSPSFEPTFEPSFEPSELPSGWITYQPTNEFSIQYSNTFSPFFGTTETRTLKPMIY
jgi:hypothetical protein